MLKDIDDIDSDLSILLGFSDSNKNVNINDSNNYNDKPHLKSTNSKVPKSTAYDISKSVQNETEQISNKIMILYLNWKIGYVDGWLIKPVDLYRIKSTKWVNLSHIKWSIWFKYLWLEHIVTREAFDYMISKFDRSVPYFSKWLKKEIEEKFW